MKHLVSLRYWKAFLTRPLRRYPIGVACILAVAVSLYVVVTTHFSNETSFRALLSLFCMVSAAFVAIAANRKSSIEAESVRRRWYYVTLAVVMVGEIAYIVWQYHCDTLHHSTIWGLVISAACAMGVLPVLHKRDGRLMLHVARRTFVNLLKSAAFGFRAVLVCMLVFFLLYGPLTLMTDIRFPEEVFIILACAVPFMLAGLKFMNLEPFGRKLVSYVPQELSFGGTHKFLLSFVAYAFLVMFLYILIIITSWELPRGYISLICCCITAVGLFAYVLVADVELPHGGTWRKIYAAIPWTLLVLQVLMTVAIFRRINDYGVTILRCYVVLLNVWAYAVCLYLIFSKKPRLLWMPVSLIAIFFIFTATPLSVTNYVRWQLIDDINYNRGRCDDKREYLIGVYGDWARERYIPSYKTDKLLMDTEYCTDSVEIEDCTFEEDSVIWME